MAHRQRNVYNPGSGIRHGLNSIANAMTAGDSQATVDYRQSQIDVNDAATAKSYLTQDQIRQDMQANKAKGDARNSIAGVFDQLNQVQAQTADMGMADSGLETVINGVPGAAAKYGVQGGLDPNSIAKYIQMAMSQGGNEDQLRRANFVTNKNAAMTTERADTLLADQYANAMNKQELVNTGKVNSKSARYNKPLSVQEQKFLVQTIENSLPTEYFDGMNLPDGMTVNDLAADATDIYQKKGNHDIAGAVQQMFNNKGNVVYSDGGWFGLERLEFDKITSGGNQNNPTATQNTVVQTGTPQRPSNIPPGSAWSASRQQWRDPKGSIYNANGTQ